MRTLATLITAASLGVLFTVPLPGHAKPLPPAFGGSSKPEVPEVEEQPRVRKKANPSTRIGSELFRRVSPKRKLQIHLDGDVDGGGDFKADRGRSRGRGDGGDLDGHGDGGMGEGGDGF